MSAQNGQTVLMPFNVGMDALVKKWKQWGWCYALAGGTFIVYDKDLKPRCDGKNIRAYIARFLFGRYAIPTKITTFEKEVTDALTQLPLVVDTIGVYRPDIPEHFIPIPEEQCALVNTCDVYIPKTERTPEDDKYIATWLDVLSTLFPDIQERKRVIQFMAHALQKPMEKPSFALLITGEQGNGKSSMLKDVFNVMLGKTYVTTFNNVSQLHTSIGAQRWANRLFCFVDDFADQTEKTSEKLKSVITQMDAVVKKLYVDEKEQNVITRFVFISNERSPIPFYDGHDRRYYAPAYSSARDVAALVDDYINKLKTDAHYRDALYRFLMDYPIDDFNAHVPEETANHKRMVGNSTSEVVQQFETIMNVEKPEYITKHWYEHMMLDLFNTSLTPTQLDKQWKQIVAHIRSNKDWVSKDIHTKIDDRDVYMHGWAKANFNARNWLATFRQMPEHRRQKWVCSVATF